jgi:PilZ domain
MRKLERTAILPFLLCYFKRREYACALGVFHVAPSNDLRRHPRLSSPKGTFIAWSTGARSLVSHIDNFALGGLFIHVEEPLPPGSYLQLLFDAPEGEVRASAVVRRAQPNKGMGVKFVAMQPEYRARLGRWLSTLSAS